MIKTLIALTLAFLFVACNAEVEEKEVTAKLVNGSNLSELTLNDQFENAHTIEAHTNKIIFAFAKESAHICNDFFNTKEAKYLQTRNTQFVADVSSAPSIIRSLFILPGLKDFKHTVLLLDDKATAAPFRKGLDTEKIIVVYVSNNTIGDIKTVSTAQELALLIEE